MATRGKTTFQKRQKEMARKEKQQMKEQRRAQRKLEPPDQNMELLENPMLPSDLDLQIYSGDDKGE